MKEPEAGNAESADGKLDTSATAGGRFSRVEISAVLFFASVGLIVVGFRLAGFALFSIPSTSMYPTLMVGDYLVVSKYSHGYSRHSFRWQRPGRGGNALTGTVGSAYHRRSRNGREMHGTL